VMSGGFVCCMMVMRPDSSLPLLLRVWAQWLITYGEDWVSRRGGRDVRGAHAVAGLG
jgi:hypothetical protein